MFRLQKMLIDIGPQKASLNGRKPLTKLNRRPK